MNTQMTQPSYEQYRIVANRLTQLSYRTSENFLFPSIDATIEWCFKYLEIPEDNKWRFTRPDITKPIAPCNLDIVLNRPSDAPYSHQYCKVNDTLMPYRSYNDIRLKIWREQNGVDNFEFDGMTSAIEWCYKEFNPSVVFGWEFATQNGVFRPGEVSVVRAENRKEAHDRLILHTKKTYKTTTGVQPEMVGRRFEQWEVVSPEWKIMRDGHKHFHMRCVNCGEDKWLCVSRFSGSRTVACPCTSPSIRMYREIPEWLIPKLMRRIYDMRRYVSKKDFRFDSTQDCAIWCYKHLPFPSDPGTPWALKKNRGAPVTPGTLWLEVDGIRTDTTKNIANVNKSRRGLRK